MIDRDRVLVETAKTRRQRLLASTTFGAVQERRVVRNNVARFVGSAVLAAVVCAVCLGFSFVFNMLESRDIEAAETAYAEALRQAQPLEPGATTDSSGRPIDPDNGWVAGPFDTWYDPLTGWRVNPESGNLVHDGTGWEVDPETGRAVKEFDT